MRCHGILLPLLLVVVMLAGLASAQTRRRQQARRQSNIRRVTRVGRPRVLLPSAPRSDEAPPPPLTQSGRGNRNGFGTEVTTSATPGVTNQREVSSRQRRTDINSVATERRTSRPTIVTTERRTERPTIVTTERRTDRPTVVTTEREQTEERRTASPTGETPSRERGRGVAGAPSGDMDTAASVTTEMLTQAISQATNAVDLLHSLEREILEKGLIAKASGTVAQQNRASRTSQEAKDLSVSALVSLEATKLLAERLGLDANQAQSLELVNITDTLLSDICLQTALVPPCIPGRYREPTGYCNNILNPRWGTSHVALRRMVANAYENGLDIMRFTSIDDSLLPSPRLISTSLHPSTSDLHSKISLMVMQWGQFIDHDIGLTPFTTGAENEPLDCCMTGSGIHPACRPIRVPIDDQFYKQHNEFCINFARSIAAPRPGCGFGARQQLNQQTAFIDGSMIYGNIDSLAESLRTGQRGLLKYTDHPGGNNLKYLLPQDTTNGDCQRTSESDNCFVAGDARSNEQVGLTSMHTILLREHNRIAEKLAKVNKYWDDETLYQEARRIVVAEIQHITYDAWLPIVLGHEHVNRGKDSDLALVNAGFYTEYDVETDPGLVNAFSTAAFRFGHSLLPDALLRLDATGTKRDPLPLREAFFRPAPIYDTSDTGGIDALMRGIATQNAEKMDSKVTAEVTEHLFQESGKPYGLDLVSLNLQRGRDHGLPGYNVYREACGLQRALTFKDLGNVMDEEQIAVLSKLYNYPDDIDLFSAGLSERPMPGGLVGPTFGCIISRQFTRLRRGDRFWYENDMPTNRFTLDQLTEIRKASLTRLLCDNGDSITTMQPNAYLIPDAYTNKRVNCDAIPKLDLSKWKDNKFQNFVKLSDQVVEQSVFLATENIKNLGELERQAYELGFGRLTDDNDPQVLHAAFLASSDYIQLVGRTARLLINATGVMQKFQKLSRRDLLERMGGLQLPDTIIPPEEDQCVAPLFVSCDYNTKYREVTGRCNNLRNLEMGMCLRPFRRLLEPVYDDVINTMRSTSVTTRALPSPRTVSNAVHRSMDAPHEEYTLALMQWGQFLDHDITFTPVSKGFNNSVLNCGRCDSAMSVSQECQPVSIPTDDSFFPATTADGSPHCMAFARSSPITDKKFGPRQQMNQITSFIDASNVYGSTMCRKEQLREGRGGRMRMQPNGNRKPLLPPLADDEEDCAATPKSRCFMAGDVRANEQPLLATTHLIWVRQHNRLVGELAGLNPHWSDEMLYEEARRIVAAMMQHITYNEFLPRVMGYEAMRRYDLTLLSSSYHDRYNNSCDATISNEFATAAFRFGHSLIQNMFKRLGVTQQPSGPDIDLLGSFFNPQVLSENNFGGVDALLRGLVSMFAQSADRFVTDRLTDHLFEDVSKPRSGLDLVSMNIQRGRDHGLNGYNAYREFCGLKKATSFSDLEGEIDDENTRNKLASVYDHVDDIDLFTGGLSERPLPGALIGPTFGCIIGEQFRRLRQCDRYWYETSNLIARFTLAQLGEIRKVTFGKVICDNSDNIPTIHPNVMSMPDDVLNARISCSSLGTINLKYWTESTSCDVDGVMVQAGTTQRVSPCRACSCPRTGGSSICSSLYVSNCYNLLVTYPAADLRADDACVTQCAYVVRAFLTGFTTELDVNQVNNDVKFIIPTRQGVVNAVVPPLALQAFVADVRK